jgi:hypothetical protein
MSWEAVRWAMDQDPGCHDKKLVLIGTCNFANKRNGKILAGAEAVADFCNYPDWRPVKKFQAELIANGFLVDTLERTGGNGRVPVLKPGWNKEQTSDELNTTNVQTGSKLGAQHARSFIGIAGHNHEPRTKDLNDNTPDTARGKPSGESLSSSNLDHRNHPKGPEFVRWCKRQGGSPTDKGFNTWIRKQLSERPKPTVFPAVTTAPPDDPVQRAKFLKQLEEWKAAGRPLDEFPLRRALKNAMPSSPSACPQKPECHGSFL